MMHTYLHLLQSAKVFHCRVGYQNETVGLGLGIGAGEAAVTGISKECNFEYVCLTL